MGPGTPSAPTSVRVEDLEVRLGGARVLRGLSAAFAPSSLTAVIGPNGAGKSTLARALVGVVRSSRGTIEIAGKNLKNYSSPQLARAVGFVPQDTHIGFAFSVSDVVMMGRYPHLRPLERERPDDHAVGSDVLAELDLGKRRERDITTLSVGERQLVLLSRALATGARVLIGDEPVSALDIGHRLQVLELLRRRSRAGQTVILVLHDLELALRFADQVLLLHEGEVRQYGKPLTVLTSPELENAFGVQVETVGDGKSLYFRPRQ
jgi:iron complex transport system ATP-binding protein